MKLVNFRFSYRGVYGEEIFFKPHESSLRSLTCIYQTYSPLNFVAFLAILSQVCSKSYKTVCTFEVIFRYCNVCWCQIQTPDQLLLISVAWRSTDGAHFLSY